MTGEQMERVIAALERIATVLNPNPQPEPEPEVQLDGDLTLHYPEMEQSDFAKIAATALNSRRIVGMHRPGDGVMGVVEGIETVTNGILALPSLTINLRISPYTLRHWRWQPGDTISMCVCDAPDLYCDVHDA